MTDLLASLGWSDHFARQPVAGTPARVAAVHRDRLDAVGESGPVSLLAPDMGALAVGDWVRHDGVRAARLAPRNELARKGVDGRRQLIAANVETLGVVSSCNADFNVARLERYVALALGADALPLVVLTKADAADPAPFLAAARALSPRVVALALDAREAAAARALDAWCGPGLTLALVGSSGVGKTTLRNALTGDEALTAGIREDDARGRHTTTNRALRPTLAGGCLIDTPGMRELGLLGADVQATFADVEALAALCRFRDCRHESEPGCAVRAAIEGGGLDPARLERSRKLAREEAVHEESVAERHARSHGWAKRMRDGQARAAWKRRGPEGE